MLASLAAMPVSLACLLVVLLASTPAAATSLLDDLGSFDIPALFGRSSCANPCGWSGQLCCASNQYCYTDSNNQAQCGNDPATTAAPNNGYWTVWTSTYTQTDLLTITSIGSSYIPTTAATATAVCNYALNESPCGSICCASNQYCGSSGQCLAASNPDSSGVYASSWTASTTTGAFSAPLRPTASTLITVTSGNAGAATTTESFIPPVATGANSTLVKAEHSSGLSGGAIAGIVIGVLLGLALLFCVCFFLCIRGLLDWLAACLGFGRRREREKVIVTEEAYRSSRHGSRRGGSYYDRPSRVQRTTSTRRGSGVKEAVGIGALLAGLAAGLGMKRARDRRREREIVEEDKRSYYSAGPSQITSESSESTYDREIRRDRERSRSRMDPYPAPPQRAASRSQYGGTVRSARSASRR